ncbi:adenosine receptor A2b isoform X1 [Orussus abietinus]|uniref:adenosine receptor A2b isoform X1 n=1 Tax=Orussus abietinus TaxID=222816 RepID=UPI0006257C11|nr:adenosine receptor A2b isoform X1 [Orussus abietinus]
MEFTNATGSPDYFDYAVTSSVNGSAYGGHIGSELNLPYAVCEILVAICAVFGNGLVILVFSKERKLRRRTNYYIISLAAADLLVGLFAIPFAILASIGLPTNLHACLFTVSVLVVLCTISIFCLVAVSVDRYWAILYPMGYSRTVRTKTAIGIICACWVAGTLVGFLPLLGWNAGKKSDEKCIFTEVMDYDYLVFLYFATIIFPALLIAAFYAHIYRVVVKQLQQIVTMNPGRRTDGQATGTMLRLLGAAQKREVKATQNLSRIVIFFIICWFPLYTINCVMAFCPDCEVNDVFLNFCIILSHLNSVGNPLLYAYHLKDFRAALKSFMHKMLFPSAETKANPGNMVPERTSMVSHHNVHQTGDATSLAQKNQKIIMQRAEDKKIPTAARSSYRLDSLARTPGSSPSVGNDADRMSSDNSESQPMEADADSPMKASIPSSCTSPNRGTLSKTTSSMELQIYRPFARFFYSDPRVEEVLPESVFVIEADINQIVSSRERLTDEKHEGANSN